MIYQSRPYVVDNEDFFIGKQSFNRRMIRAGIRKRALNITKVARNKTRQDTKRRYSRGKGWKRHSISPPAIKPRKRFSIPLKRTMLTAPKAGIKRITKFQPDLSTTLPSKSVENKKKGSNNKNLYIGMGVATIVVMGLLIYIKNKR